MIDENEGSVLEQTDIEPLTEWAIPPKVFRHLIV